MNLPDCRCHQNEMAWLARIMAGIVTAGAVVLAACAGPTAAPSTVPSTGTALPPPGPTHASATATAPSTPAAGGPALLAFASDRAGAGDIFVVGDGQAAGQPDESPGRRLGPGLVAGVRRPDPDLPHRLHQPPQR